MTHPVTYRTNYQNKDLTIETSKLALQATSSVQVTLGNSSVLAAVVVGKPSNLDYLPLQVVYEERLYAVGKIKSSRFIKREGRPSDNAILTGRLIDRSLRSLFDNDIRNDIQVVITVLSLDGEVQPDFISVFAASIALNLCGFMTKAEDGSTTNIFNEVVGAVRVGQKIKSFGDNIYIQIEELLQNASTFDQIKNPLLEVSQILNPEIEEDINHYNKIYNLISTKNISWAKSFEEIYKSTQKLTSDQINQKYNLEPEFLIQPSYDNQKISQIDLLIAGTKNNITMIEGASQIVSEETMAKALQIGFDELSVLSRIGYEFLDECQKQGVTKTTELTLNKDYLKGYDYFVNSSAKIEELVFSSTDKNDRKNKLSQLINENIENFSKVMPDIDAQKVLENGLEHLVKKIVKENIITKSRRLDGRALNETRKLLIETEILPATHGSSLFQRGETQVLNVLTLGTLRDAQTIDEMEDFDEQTKRYMHHYNFPAYSVGETGRYSGPNRREIGHGFLAEKALYPVLPSEIDFPYTIRLVSECLGSNGSTSMASTCASTLSLLDGGVPIKDLVAGVAMGLVMNENEFKVLTDIQGAEDHYGDMDFKVTGTSSGITAFQLDNKVKGLKVEVLVSALNEAKLAREYILGEMKKVISRPKPEISKHAPRVITFQVQADKIGEIIGPSGKMIKSIIQKYDVEIDINDLTSIVYIYGKDSQKATEAAEYIKKLVKSYQKGDVVNCEIFRIENYGAFAKIDSSDKEGLIHISEISSQRINKVEDALEIGQKIQAVVVELNEKGQISLSIKKLNQA
jgi:polyribonucleotide nucleotidyltransferase